MTSRDRDNVIPFVAPHDGADDAYFEARLRRALAVALPVDLDHRILLRQTTEARRGAGRRFGIGWWRTAAAIAFTIAGAAWFFSLPTPALALPRLAIEHSRVHGFSTSGRAARISPSQVRALFAASGVRLDTPPAEIDFAKLCELGPQRSVHLLSRQPAGPVHIYFVPNHGDLMRMDFREAGYVGRSVPLARGALLLLAAGDADFDHLEALWRDALTLPSAG